MWRVPALVSEALPTRCSSWQAAAVASQNLTCPWQAVPRPRLLQAVSVTAVPEATAVAGFRPRSERAWLW